MKSGAGLDHVGEVLACFSRRVIGDGARQQHNISVLRVCHSFSFAASTSRPAHHG